jgi:hypothetical protein
VDSADFRPYRPGGHATTIMLQAPGQEREEEGTVPLSEHERRQFEQIEAALRAGDPRVHYRRRVIAAALGLWPAPGCCWLGSQSTSS